MSGLTVLTYNVNSYRQVETGGRFADVYSEFAFAKRYERLIANIKMANADVVGLCELDKTSLEMMKTGLTELGYKILNEMPYVPGDSKSFYFLIVSKSVICLLTQQLWFTSTPTVPLTVETRKLDPVLLETKEEFEKGTLIAVFEHEDQAYVYSLNHFGLRLPYKQKCVEILKSRLERELHVYRYATGKYMQDINNEMKFNIIIAGDFNTFREDPDFLQPLIGHMGLQHKLNVCTFIGYPYDIGVRADAAAVLERYNEIEDPVEKRMFMGRATIGYFKGPLVSQLDHVITNVKDCVTHTLKEVDMDKLETNYLESCRTGTPLTASDHFATVCEI